MPTDPRVCSGCGERDPMWSGLPRPGWELVLCKHGTVGMCRECLQREIFRLRGVIVEAYSHLTDADDLGPVSDMAAVELARGMLAQGIVP